MSAPESRSNNEVVAPVHEGPPAAKDEGEENLPFLAKLLNHILTPGSSLTPTTWVVFNILIFLLFLCWLMFVYAMPSSIHVWVFGFLGLGFAISTNWFMKIVFSSGMDFASQQQKAAEAAKDGSTDTISPADPEQTSEKPIEEKKKD